jgi:hypothetical protein
MATVAFSELVPEVLATASACPTPTIVRNLRNAARELCEQSDCYRFTIDNTVVVANQSDVEIAVPSSTTMHKAVTLQLNSKRIKPFSVVMQDHDDEGWRDKPGTPEYFMRSNETLNAVRLIPTPDTTLTTNGLKGEVSLKPSRTATGVDDIFMDRFHSTLVDGALAKLLAVSSAPWFDPQLAAYHAQLFNAAKDEARRIADGDDMPKLRKLRYGG